MKIINKRFNRNYKEIEIFEAGVVLFGSEVKSIRLGGLRIDDAFIKIVGNEAFLINANIPIYKFSKNKEYDSKRTRKLLLNKKEILKLKIKLSSSSKLTIIPLSCYNKHGLIKFKIALARGRSDVGRKKLEKKKKIKREEEKKAKEYLKN